eukprot:jgi/Orpsp1_1/1182283/evm.model.c7180000080633.1
MSRQNKIKKQYKDKKQNNSSLIEIKEKLDLKLDDRQKLSGTKNFKYWFKLIEQTAENAGFSKFLNNNIINELKNDNNVDNDKLNEAVLIDGELKLMILRNVHENVFIDIEYSETASDMIRRLKASYYDQQADTAYWIKELNSLKSNNNKNDLIKNIDKIFDIFNNMRNQNINFIGKESNNDTISVFNDNINYDDIRPLTENIIGCLNYTNNNNTNNITNDSKSTDNQSININKSISHNINNHSIDNTNSQSNKATTSINNEINNEILKTSKATVLLHKNPDCINLISENNKSTNIYNTIIINWLYDSGAAEHITNDISILNNFVNKRLILKCANGSPCEFDGYGSCCISINNYQIHLERVLYSKSATMNIISGIQLARINIKAIITLINDDVHLKLINQNSKNIASFTANNYNQIIITSKYCKNNYSNIDLNYISTITDESKMIWHRRLGHFYHENIEKFLKLHNIKSPSCLDCKITKMKKKPHNQPVPKATNILEVIHSNIIGPISESINGHKFVITFIDEASRKSWIFNLKSKADAIDIIINTIKYLNNIFDNIKVKNFKSDQGREYQNRKIIKFCNDNGINKIYSPPYNPENNGLAERYNQTIISCAKTLLFWSKLSQNFWDYAIVYSNYLYNNTPHSGIDNKIPNEAYFLVLMKILTHTLLWIIMTIKFIKHVKLFVLKILPLIYLSLIFIIKIIFIVTFLILTQLFLLIQMLHKI